MNLIATLFIALIIIMLLAIIIINMLTSTTFDERDFWKTFMHQMDMQSDYRNKKSMIDSIEKWHLN